MTARTQLTTPLPRHIHLQAIDQARNVARDYQIEACLDLFGHWIVALHWGRIGTRGQSRQLSFDNEG
jgi:predicted DNA-binding WGR domain protein